MCMLTYFPPLSRVDEERLRNGSVVNNDGHGWAVIHSDGRSILSGRSMDFETALAEFLVVRALHPATDAMFHSRYTTHGLTNLDNCHPFRVPGKFDTFVAHNGVLPCTPEKGDPRSDTRLFTESLLLQRYPHLDSKKTINRLEAWMGYNKILILTVNPRYAANAYLVKGRLGEWVDGVWYSNSGHMKKKPWSGLSNYSTEAKWEKNADGVWTASYPPVTDGEYESWDDAWDDYAYRTGRLVSVRAEADKLADDGDISLPLVRDGNAAYYYSADGREGAVLGPREPDTSYQPQLWQCPDARCRSFDVDPELGICMACEGCLDCSRYISECECDPEADLDTAAVRQERLITAVVAVFKGMGIRIGDHMQGLMRSMTPEGLERVHARVLDVSKEYSDTAGVSAAAVRVMLDASREASNAAKGGATGWPVKALPASPGILTSLGVGGNDGSTVTVVSAEGVA